MRSAKIGVQDSFVTEKDLIGIEPEIFGIGKEKTFHVGDGRKKVILILFDGLEDVFPHPCVFLPPPSKKFFWIPSDF
jgi:hypothetical protein